MASIYGLYDRTGALRYIGKANDPAKRLASHMREVRRRRTPLYDWLAKHGRPDMRVLEANCADWREEERRLIAEARARGERLLNVAEGGDEPFCSTEQRSQNARALNARLAKDPRAARIREIKRAIMSAARQGHLSEVQRAKFRDLAAYAPHHFSVFGGL